MTAACTNNVTTQGVVLHLAFELDWTQWKLAFTIGHGQKPRQRTIRARDLAWLRSGAGREALQAAAKLGCQTTRRARPWDCRTAAPLGQRRTGQQILPRLHVSRCNRLVTSAMRLDW
jgi:hypothetical protein